MGYIYEMSNRALFNKSEPIFLSNNAEGAILLSIVLQNLEGPLIT